MRKFNILLILIIIVNIILLSLRSSDNREGFADGAAGAATAPLPRKIETRPCTLHLTNDNDLCEKLAEVYKLSPLQIQVQMNKMKDAGNQGAYDLMKYVKDNKKNLPVNACKIELQKMKEVRNIYGSSNINVNKNIYRNLNYNTETLSGYCLSDVSQYADFDSSNILNILKSSLSSNLFVEPTAQTTVDNIIDDNNSKYMAVRVVNKIPIQTLLQDTASICKDVNVVLDNNVKFLRIHCSLLNEVQLSADHIDLVSYNQNSKKFDIVDDGSKATSNMMLDQLFTYAYDKKQILYQPNPYDVMIYKLAYNYCGNVEEYTIFDSLKFSIGELNIAPRIIRQNIDLGIYSSNAVGQGGKNMPDIIGNAIMDIFKTNGEIENTLLTYTSNQELMLADISKLRREICPSIMTNNNQKAMCILRANAIEDQYNFVEVQKYQLNEKLANQRRMYQLLLDTSYKIQTSKMTLYEINEIIKTGVGISYSKYAELISNDDCLYLAV
jgi:hypothetical protein